MNIKPLTPKHRAPQIQGISLPTKSYSILDVLKFKQKSQFSKENDAKKAPELSDELGLIEFMKPHINAIRQLNLEYIQQELTYKEVCLISPPEKSVLILDLDETMIYNGMRDESNPVNCIFVRPFADEFLKEMSEIFEIWAWTASNLEYANYILAVLDPHDKYFKVVLAQDDCTVCGENLVKDIRMFTNLDMKRVIILDNLLVSFAASINNGILISPFINQKSDNELSILKGFLLALHACDDYREVIRATFKYHDYSE